MKLTDYIIVFFIIFGCMTLFVFYGVNLDSKAKTTNIQYADTLTSACYDASRTIERESGSDGAWEKESAREKTLETFYSTLEFCFNTEFTLNADETHRYTPVVCLIDNNGYYISYNSTFDDYGNVYINGEVSAKYNTKSSAPDKKAYYESMTVSPINTWTKAYNDYIVRFYLDDTIEIIEPNGNVVKDKKNKIIEIFDKRLKDGGDEALRAGYELYKINAAEDDEIRTLGDLLKGTYLINGESVSMYDYEKAEIIVSIINTEVDYYINNQNPLAAGNEVPYEFTMPDIAGEDWHRLLENPTVISFLQGRQASTGREFANVYSLAGGELAISNRYYITGEGNDKEYHRLKATNCEYYEVRIDPVTEDEKHLGGKHIEDMSHYYGEKYILINKNTGEEKEILHTYATMEECALEGATPCRCAITNNVNPY